MRIDVDVGAFLVWCVSDKKVEEVIVLGTY